MKVIGLSGSIREGSHTRKAVEIALQGAKDAGLETELLDFRDYELPLCDAVYHDEHAPVAVKRLREKLREADGLILGTPEYHGSLSGVLKNALDWMTSAELSGKVWGLVGVSGGAVGPIDALSHLRLIGRSLHAVVVPTQAVVPQVWKSIADPQVEKRLRSVGREVAQYVVLHRSPEARALLAAVA